MDEPFRMSCARCDVAIDLGGQCRRLALTTAQQSVEQPRRPRLSEHPSRVDCLSDDGVLGDLRVEQLAETDDRERLHFWIERLARIRQQPREQRLQTDVPPDAVVGQRTNEPPLLRVETTIRDEQTVERATRHDLRNDAGCARANGSRAAHDGSRVPSSR